MNNLAIVAVLIFAIGFTGAFSISAYGEEGVSIVSAESETVSASSGKSISVKSVCPRGTSVIGGGGECYGFLNTEGRVVLSKNAPVSGESSWLVECTNVNPDPGDVQARAWAVCADPSILVVREKR